jgi:hypothetical protein
VFQAQPLHAVENGLHGFRRRAGDIGVLDAQDEGAAMATGVGPGEQRGAGAADVQVTGGAGGETGADRLHGINLNQSETCQFIQRARKMLLSEIEAGCDNALVTGKSQNNIGGILAIFG